MVRTSFGSARGLAGLACVDDADGLGHHTDVVGNGSAHVGLELFGNLAQRVPDAAQDLLFLLFAHGSTSVFLISKMFTRSLVIVLLLGYNPTHG